MASKDGFLSLEWEGLEELIDQFEHMGDKFEEALVDGYTEYGLLVEEGSRALAGYDTGDLEQSITFDRAELNGDTVTVEGGSNLSYALRRHEEPYRMGVHDKYDNGSLFPNYYVGGRGRATARKPTWMGMRPGRKFMENAILATETNYNDMLQRIMDITLGGGRK
ncbi:hypothetical protein CHH91_04605 [Virgibacillus sp. 7505]|uniref:HK97 gp10 family phage protein n=1 Tax=Virgibacillus sp. 7505 TaxID=2022548 RepID=UPI000BA666B6|nr:HK97 gp10 family phage protein [Virgibacillus sp. 7505]PAE17290.1 hypothetical protein CHH91_04605 [Virgibacillus sp. 7505]